jgi:hypothetical protein
MATLPREPVSPDASGGGGMHCHIEPEGGAVITLAVFPTRDHRRAKKGRLSAVHLDAYT